jgi:hypothetical protein
LADERTYIKLHDGMPDHPKVDTLSDKGFRHLVESWCWCSRHLTDGRMPLATFLKRTTPRTRKELIATGLVEVHDTHVVWHDYLEHQRSAAQVEEIKEAKRQAARKGNHKRWHEGEGGRFDPACEFCVPDGQSTEDSSQQRSHMRSQNDRKTSPETETETDKEKELTQPDLQGARNASRATKPAIDELAASAHSLEAHRLVEAYAASRNRRPPGRIMMRLGPLIDELLNERWPPDLVAEALTAWGDKGLDPSVFPSVANEIANRKPLAGNGKPATTDQRTAAVQALKHRFAEGGLK